MSERGVKLFTDGGGELGVSAGSACIVEDERSGVVHKWASFLGVATNNEAEIFAGLMGYSVLLSEAFGACSVHWVCDSEYVLKSATQYILNWQKNGWKTASKKPVKNQGLWRTYLALSKGHYVLPEHVRGHTGHPENEACDYACNFARAEGVEVLESSGATPVISTSLKDGLGETQWQLFDGRAILQDMREEFPEEEALSGIVTLMGLLKNSPGA